MKKNVKKIIEKNKKPLIIAAIGAGVAAVTLGLVKAFSNMKKSAKAQHEVDKANFAAAKAGEKTSLEAVQGYIAQLDAAYNALETTDAIPVEVTAQLPTVLVKEISKKDIFFYILTVYKLKSFFGKLSSFLSKTIFCTEQNENVF
mgnify:CR=1 FL=1